LKSPTAIEFPPLANGEPGAGLRPPLPSPSSTATLSLKELTAAADIVSRIGGEEFALLHDAALRPAAQLAETLRAAIGRIARPDGQLSASFGVAEYRPGESVMALLDRADEALLRAKYSGRNRVCAERATLVDPVRLTWSHVREDGGAASQPIRQQWDDFWLTSHFQPLYSLSHQKQVGFEALLRGEREDGAQVPPVELFSPKPFTDQGELDRTSHALHLSNARRLIPDDAWVFLNILPATFVADGYPDQLAEIAQSAGIPPERVVLELLESHGGSVDDMSRAAGQYRDHGFLIAVVYRRLHLMIVRRHVRRAEEIPSRRHGRDGERHHGGDRPRYGRPRRGRPRHPRRR